MEISCLCKLCNKTVKIRRIKIKCGIKYNAKISGCPSNAQRISSEADNRNKQNGERMKEKIKSIMCTDRTVFRHILQRKVVCLNFRMQIYTNNKIHTYFIEMVKSNAISYNFSCALAKFYAIFFQNAVLINFAMIPECQKNGNNFTFYFYFGMIYKTFNLLRCVLLCYFLLYSTLLRYFFFIVLMKARALLFQKNKSNLIQIKRGLITN